MQSLECPALFSYSALLPLPKIRTWRMKFQTCLSTYTRYSLFPLREPRLLLRTNGERGFLRVNRLYLLYQHKYFCACARLPNNKKVRWRPKCITSIFTLFHCLVFLLRFQERQSVCPIYIKLQIYHRVKNIISSVSMSTVGIHLTASLS